MSSQTHNSRKGEVTVETIQEWEAAIEMKLRKLRTYRRAMEQFGMESVTMDGVKAPERAIEELESTIENLMIAWRDAKELAG